MTQRFGKSQAPSLAEVLPLAQAARAHELAEDAMGEREGDHHAVAADARHARLVRYDVGAAVAVEEHGLGAHERSLHAAEGDGVGSGGHAELATECAAESGVGFVADFLGDAEGILDVAEFRVPATSPNLVESKSFKLYLNAFAQHRVHDTEQLRAASDHLPVTVEYLPAAVRG